MTSRANIERLELARRLGQQAEVGVHHACTYGMAQGRGGRCARRAGSRGSSAAAGASALGEPVACRSRQTAGARADAAPRWLTGQPGRRCRSCTRSRACQRTGGRRCGSGWRWRPRPAAQVAAAAVPPGPSRGAAAKAAAAAAAAAVAAAGKAAATTAAATTKAAAPAGAAAALRCPAPPQLQLRVVEGGAVAVQVFGAGTRRWHPPQLTVVANNRREGPDTQAY